MPPTPYLIQTGMGVDLHGLDDTTAARRAVEDAIRHNSLLFLAHAGLAGPDQIHVTVTIATPHPDHVDLAAIQATLPVGDVSVEAVSGGMLAATGPTATGEAGDPVLVANAAVLVSLDRP